MSDDNPNAIIHPSHWPSDWMTRDLAEYRNGLLQGIDAARIAVQPFLEDGPAAFFSLGDGEATFWAYQQMRNIPGVQLEWLDAAARSSSFPLSEWELFWPEIDLICTESDVWHIQCNWPLSEAICYASLESMGVEFTEGKAIYLGREKTKADANAIYHLGEFGLWEPLLTGKRLAIVGGLADQLASRFILNGWEVVLALKSPSIYEPKAPVADQLTDALLSNDRWDLLLCAAGGLSSILCHRVKRAGRKGFDIGQNDHKIISGELR